MVGVIVYSKFLAPKPVVQEIVEEQPAEPAVVRKPVFTDAVHHAIDLAGDGLKVVPLTASNVHRDHNGDGFAELSAWLSPGDGFIVVDGSFPESEAWARNGTLSTLDTSGDGLINNSDESFAAIRIWQDANSDGVVDTDETSTLSDLFISAIPTTLFTDPTTHAGIVVSAVGEIARWNLEPLDFAQLRFEIEPSDTVTVVPPGFRFHPDVLVMARIEGAGLVPNSAVAMSQDARLRDMGREAMDRARNGDVVNFLATFDGMLLALGDADTPDSFAKKWIGGEQGIAAGIEPEPFQQVRDDLAISFLVQAADLHVPTQADRLFAEHPLIFLVGIERGTFESEAARLQALVHQGLRSVAGRSLRMEDLAELVKLMVRKRDIDVSQARQAIQQAGARGDTQGSARALWSTVMEDMVQ